MNNLRKLTVISMVTAILLCTCIASSVAEVLSFSPGVNMDNVSTAFLQEHPNVELMQSVLYLLGGGIAVLLGFVGLLNFVNILSASIVRRKVEFAILESIGMTKRQLRQQVIYEGASYAIIAILLFSTLGTTLTLILLNVFSSQVSYALCRYPVLPTLLIVIALILLSAVIPTILFQCSRKTSLIDRLRSVE